MNPFEDAKVKEIDAKYFGMTEMQMVENAGKAVAEWVENYIKEKNNTNPEISIICGLGNNGADGMAAAVKLVQEKDRKVNVYLIGRKQDLKTPEAEEIFKRLKKLEKEVANLSMHHDSYAKDITSSDIIIEALLGSGIKGNLRKRFKDVINKVARLKAYKIALDHPVSGYQYDVVLSLISPKLKDAVVLDIGLPDEVSAFIGPGIIQTLYTPPTNAYKGVTGELFVFGGSELFHGAPIMSIRAASKLIGSVFFYTHPENRELVKELKLEVQEFIALTNSEVEKYAEYVDVFLAGPGLEDNLVNKSLLTYLLNKYTDKTFVLDAYAIAMANPIHNKQNKRGFKNCILTPHRGELRHIFDDTKLEGLEGKLKRFAIENECYVLLKGSTDLLFNPDGIVKMNKTGNPGMAKGGTGDVLAGVVAALACKNDQWTSLQAGGFLSGLAGDLAQAKYGYNYSATDEIPLIQEAYKRALEYSN